MAESPSSRNRKVVGIVGGVASGKSAVARYLAELGGLVLNADKITHEVLQQPEVIETLVNRFGAGILGPAARLHDRSLDRSAIAKLVFGDSPEHQDNRHFLESVVQKRVRNRLLDELASWQLQACDGNRDGANALSSRSFLVLDIPLLFERDWDRYCDFVLMVDTPDDKRRENAARRGWSDSDWQRRENNQWPVARKRERATHIIHNDSDLDNLKRRVSAWHNENIGFVNN